MWHTLFVVIIPGYVTVVSASGPSHAFYTQERLTALCLLCLVLPHPSFSYSSFRKLTFPEQARQVPPFLWAPQPW